MTKLLLRLFVRGYPETPPQQLRPQVGAMAGAVGMGCNVLLFAAKLIIGLLSGSVSIMADAMNNLSDASGSIVTLLGFRLADKPADAHHPYGHARAEYLSGLAVAVLILFIGLELVKSSVEKIFRPAPLEATATTLLVLGLSIGVKLWMSVFNRSLGDLIGSKALHATAQDSANDCVATTAVLAASVLEMLFDVRVDGWMGLAVAAFILRSGYHMAVETISPILGENADPELREKIVDYIRSQPQVLGYHDLMVHDYGPTQRYASLHVEMDCRMDPLDCHDAIDLMERECLRSHNVHLVIHYDPIVTDDPELSRLRELVLSLLRQEDDRLTLHDFRMIQGKRHMNLVFDVALPNDLQSRAAHLRSHIAQTLTAREGKEYHVKITFDTVAYEA